jgi:hypothetical protein
MHKNISNQYNILAESMDFFGGSMESVLGQQLPQILSSSY